MSWQDQGRQDNGRFGNGTAAQPAEAGRPGSDPRPGATELRHGIHTSLSTAGFMAENARQYEGGPSVGNGDCVALVQRATGAPITSEWTRGAPVWGNPRVLPNTAIASFDPDGSYGNHTDGTSHAAVMLSQKHDGIVVLDQWRYVDNAGNVILRRPTVRMIYANQPWRPKVDQAEAYYVIQKK